MMNSNVWFCLVCSVVPLLSMSNSVLLCISTLLESGNHYSKMFELTDNLGRKLFEVTATRTNFYVPTILTVFVLYTQCISITLVCDDCLLTDYPERYESRAFEPASLCTISIIFRDG